MKLQELKSSTGKTYLTIHYDEQNKWVYNDWIGYVTPENVKQGSLAVLEAIKQHSAACGLNDNRHLVGRWDDSVEWIEDVWIPAAAEAGLQYYAHVANEDAFAAASSSNMLSRVQGRFEMRIFGGIKEARDWLTACQQK
ncbi:STAS/SEC14 domain-containing protein [Pontibacter sp. FD36]|uniref:STAS/SEC14 domain-containing protein n=1 Tax=Pontibacter sp. FD36 TaxID=2789860 RepID=UPI0018A8DFA0|nr:STAS/SEC14 domain-containing protein [Pontibacter sp. FD36]MBF8964140.1 STAS/SEC14 domain-containing protein [Pontibacter sp. FD36]